MNVSAKGNVPMGEFFDRQGKPLTTEQWSELHSDFNYKVVIKTDIHDCQVSTVWLGSDHGFGNLPKPIIFETMIFGGLWNDFSERYATEEEARQSHQTIVEMIEHYHRGWSGMKEWVRIS